MPLDKLERFLLILGIVSVLTAVGYYIKGTYKIYKATDDTYLLLLISDEVVKDGTKTTGFNYSLDTIIINDDNLQLGESYTCKRSTSLY